MAYYISAVFNHTVHKTQTSYRELGHRILPGSALHCILVPVALLLFHYTLSTLLYQSHSSSLRVITLLLALPETLLSQFSMTGC